MKKIPIALAIGLIVAGGLSVSAQTLVLQLKGANYSTDFGTWSDSSGNNDTATWSGAGTPTLATVNGVTVVDFTHGTGTFTLGSSLAGTSGYTVFAYILSGGVYNSALTGGTGSGGLEYRVRATGKQSAVAEWQAELGDGNAIIPTTSWSLIGEAVNSSGNAYRFNGASDGTGTARAFTGSITQVFNNMGGGEGFNGSVAELDIYSGAMTTEQMQTVEAGLLSTYSAIPVPEPTTLAMMAGGFGLLFAARRFRK
jgi:hypothetical protein